MIVGGFYPGSYFLESVPVQFAIRFLRHIVGDRRVAVGSGGTVGVAAGDGSQRVRVQDVRTVNLGG